MRSRSLGTIPVSSRLAAARSLSAGAKSQTSTSHLSFKSKSNMLDRFHSKNLNRKNQPKIGLNCYVRFRNAYVEKLVGNWLKNNPNATGKQFKNYLDGLESRLRTFLNDNPKSLLDDLFE
jgi:hypothetical protein